MVSRQQEGYEDEHADADGEYDGDVTEGEEEEGEEEEEDAMDVDDVDDMDDLPHLLNLSPPPAAAPAPAAPAPAAPAAPAAAAGRRYGLQLFPFGFPLFSLASTMAAAARGMPPAALLLQPPKNSPCLLSRLLLCHAALGHSTQHLELARARGLGCRCCFCCF